MPFSSMRKYFGLAVAAIAFTFVTTSFAIEKDSSASAVSVKADNPRPSQQVDPNKLVNYRNSVPAQVATSRDEGRTGSAVIEGTIGLHRTDEMQQAVDLLEKRIQDPTDSLYHQWLTPEELGKSFPPSADGVTKLTAWLQSYGLTVVSVDAPRLQLTFSGPASKVEAAFNTEIHNFTAADGTAHYSNITNPSVARSIYGLTGQFKLDNFAGEMKNYVGAVVAPKAGALSELKPVAPDSEEVKIGTGSEPLQSLGFTITPGFVEPNTTTKQTLTVTYATKAGEVAPTGKLSIVGDEKLGTLGTADLQGCKSDGKSGYACSYSWTPSIDMPTGEHKIAAAYSGDSKYAPQFTTAAVRSYGTTATTTTISASAINQASSSTITFTSVTTWTGSGATPTGTVTLSCNTTYSPSSCSGAPAAVNVTTCTVSASAKTITCAIPWNLFNSTPDYGGYGVTATYSGDTTYAGSNGLIFVDENEALGLGSVSISASPNFTAPGSGATITYTIVYSAISYSNDPITTQDPYVELTGLPIAGGQSITAGTSCTWNATTYQMTCSITSAVPTSLAAATYTVGVEFSGDEVDEAVTNSTSIIITSATEPSTVTVSLNPSTVTFASGASSTVTIKQSWTGANYPSGSIKLSDAYGALPTVTIPLTSCAYSNKVYTCTYVWTNASTADTASDTVTAVYDGDTNFEPSSGSAALTVTAPSGTNLLSSGTYTISGSFTYGESTTRTVTFSVTGASGIAAPTGTVLLSATAPVGTMALVNLTTSSYCATSSTGTGSNKKYKVTCTAVPYTAPASLPVGTYQTYVNYPGDSNYEAAVFIASATYTLKVVQQTPTLVMASPLAASPVSQPQGYLSYFTVTSTLTWLGGGTAPTASDVTFSSTAAGSFGSVSCGATSPATCSAVFTPTSTDTTGNYNINVKYAGDSNYAATTVTAITANFKITAAPNITFTSVSHNFGSEAVGTAAPNYSLVLTNSSANAFPFAIVFTPANGFTEYNNCPASVAAGGTCTILFEFTPAATGTVTASWSLTPQTGFSFGPSNGGTLTGTGTSTGSVTLTTNGHNWGNVTVGTTGPTYGVVLTNGTTAAVTLTLGSVTSPFASATNCPASLASGASCNIQFTVTPTTAGTVQQIYSLAANGGAVPIETGGVPQTGIKLTVTGD